MIKIIDSINVSGTTGKCIGKVAIAVVLLLGSGENARRLGSIKTSLVLTSHHSMVMGRTEEVILGGSGLLCSNLRLDKGRGLLYLLKGVRLAVRCLDEVENRRRSNTLVVVVLLVREESSRRHTGRWNHKTTAGIGLLEEWGMAQRRASSLDGRWSVANLWLHLF